MKLEELYSKFDGMVTGTLNVSPVDHFLFDLGDENSQSSLKATFPGIEATLMPEAGKYLVVAPIVEDPNVLILMFPEQTNGNLALKALNKETRKVADLTNGTPNKIEEFSDFSNKDEITTRFNEFVFNPNGNSTDEVKDIGSYDITNDEPVEVNNNDNIEDTEMKFKPIAQEAEDATKWVEIPNTNAHGVTVTEDGEEAATEDPFADEAPAQDGGDAAAPAPDAAAAPEGGDATADAPAPEGDATAEAPAEQPAADATTDDPKAKMRDLLSYYTNYMNELVQDPNTSTELISATQEMIDSLIGNMESADAIEEVKADAEEEAKDDANAEAAPTEEAPAEQANEGAGCAAGGALIGSVAGPIGTAAGAALGAAVEGTNKNTKPVQEGAGCAAAGAVLGSVAGPVGTAAGAALGAAVEDTDPEKKQAELDAKIDSEVDDLHKDEYADISPATGSTDITLPGDLKNSPVMGVDLTDTTPTPEEDLMGTSPDLTAEPTSQELDDMAPLTPDEEDTILGPDDTMELGADGLPTTTYDGDIDTLGATPAAKKIMWSSDYNLNGIATSDDNSQVVPEVLKELSDYYTKVSQEVSKVPGKEDVAMKLQKIQILSQTIANEWNAVMAGIGDCCANSFDRSNMTDFEKDDIDTIDTMAQVQGDVDAEMEKDQEDDLAINDQIAAFIESSKQFF